MIRYVKLLEPTLEVKTTDYETAQTTKSRGYVSVRYTRIMALLEQQNDHARKLKEEVMGDQTPITSPDMYDVLDLLDHKKITLRDWNLYSVHEQAQTIAHAQLSGMVSIVRRFDEVMRDRQRKNEDKAKQKQQAAARKTRGKL